MSKVLNGGNCNKAPAFGTIIGYTTGVRLRVLIEGFDEQKGEMGYEKGVFATNETIGY
jgi:hypothetical protein